MNKTFSTIIVLILLVLGVFGFLYFRNNKTEPVVTNILSFEDCEKAGYPVMESNPRQCRTPDGRTYAEEITPPITYNNATSNNIVVTNPFPGAVTGKEFTVIGKARGTWYFEASFPVEVRDKYGKIIFQAPAQAQGEWMTQDFVPFSINVKVPASYIGPATLILRKDNPSGLPEHEASISFPITIEY